MANENLSREDLHRLVWGRLAQAGGTHGRGVADFTPSGLAEFVAEAVQEAVDPPLTRSDLMPLREQVEKLAGMLEKHERDEIGARARDDALVDAVLTSEKRVYDNLRALRADYSVRQDKLDLQLTALSNKITTVQNVADGTQGTVTRYRNAIAGVVLAAIGGVLWVVQHYFDAIVGAILRGIPPKG